MRRHNVVPNMEDGEIDENFWAAAAADRADDGAGGMSLPLFCVIACIIAGVPEVYPLPCRSLRE